MIAMIIHNHAMLPWAIFGILLAILAVTAAATEAGAAAMPFT